MNTLKINVILQAIGASKQDLARETGLSVFYLSRLLNGRIGRPTRLTKRRLAVGIRQLVNDDNVV